MHQVRLAVCSRDHFRLLHKRRHYILLHYSTFYSFACTKAVSIVGSIFGVLNVHISSPIALTLGATTWCVYLNVSLTITFL